MRVAERRLEPQWREASEGRLVPKRGFLPAVSDLSHICIFDLRRRRSSAPTIPGETQGAGRTQQRVGNRPKLTKLSCYQALSSPCSPTSAIIVCFRTGPSTGLRIADNSPPKPAPRQGGIEGEPYARLRSLQHVATPRIAAQVEHARVSASYGHAQASTRSLDPRRCRGRRDAERCSRGRSLVVNFNVAFETRLRGTGECFYRVRVRGCNTRLACACRGSDVPQSAASWRLQGPRCLRQARIGR